jgi:hypothetical protein
LSHTPFRQHLDADDLHDLLRIPRHEIRSLIDFNDADEFPGFFQSRTTRGGGYSSLAVSMEAM